MYREKQVVLMDVDGVLLNLLPTVTEYIYKEYNKTITPEMLTTWDWDYALGIPVNSSKCWEYIMSSELVPYPEAISFIKTLKSLDFEVIAVSQRSKPAAIANAERQFSAFDFDRYILCSQFEDKVKHAHEIGARWSLEDNPKIAASLGRGKSDLASFIIDRPWNQYSIALTEDYQRVYNYSQFISRVHEERNTE